MRSEVGIERITGLVLAGGRGSRMGSVDKGLQAFRGEPMVAHVLARLVPQVGPIVIAANRNRDRYEAFGHRVVADRVADYAGPLAGLHAGLTVCETDFLVAVPCDAPSFPLDLVERLSRPFADGNVDAAVARTASGLHPVFCMIRRNVVGELARFLDGGGRGVAVWIARLHGGAVSFDDERAFDNLNTIDELRDAERDG